MRRFYSTNIEGNTITLDAEESRHLAAVLRLKPADKVEVINGEGTLFQCEVVDANKKATSLHILKEKKEIASEHGIWMAVAPTKNLNRWEWFLEKATEIGLDRITPIFCDNSERKVLKRDRQLRILREALKQSQQLLLPNLDEAMSFNDFMNIEFEGEKYIAHCEEGEKKMLKELHSIGEKALILIGAEGDFSPNEISIAKSKGFRAISLGDSRLRTETAAIVAVHSLKLLNA